MRTLMWFREHDLRSTDNAALYYASEQASDGMLAIFFITPDWWQQHDMASVRQAFLLRQLPLLKTALEKYAIPFYWIMLEKAELLPKTLLGILQQNHIEHLFFNTQYEVNEQRRDAKITKSCLQHGIQVHSYDDQVILPPGKIVTAKNQFFTVFTPFKNAWIKYYQTHQTDAQPYPAPRAQRQAFSCPLQNIEITSLLQQWYENHPSIYAMESLWPAGEKSAHQRLQTFIEHHVENYHHNRDFPALNDSTSRLSAYLTSGILSPRQCLAAAVKKNQSRVAEGNVGITTWINELIWREFYKHVLVGFPRVSMHRAFQLATDKLPWRKDENLFIAWKNGQTGFPFIDAAMRQLQQTGWMHNRLRMVVAMFLSKNLLIDWRWGEKYFMQHLIDGDLAANNGGWQWSASTGTDAAPYFRIFNPITQSERFDPEGKFIKHYCPELKDLSAKEIHNPAVLPPLIRQSLRYPTPIVDLAASRQQAIALFRQK